MSRTNDYLRNLKPDRWQRKNLVRNGARGWEEQGWEEQGWEEPDVSKITSIRIAVGDKYVTSWVESFSVDQTFSDGIVITMKMRIDDVSKLIVEEDRAGGVTLRLPWSPIRPPVAKPGALEGVEKPRKSPWGPKNASTGATLRSINATESDLPRAPKAKTGKGNAGPGWAVPDGYLDENDPMLQQEAEDAALLADSLVAAWEREQAEKTKAEKKTPTKV